MEAIEHRLGLSGAAADAHLAVLTDDALGLIRDGRVTRAELETVAVLRGLHGIGEVLALEQILKGGLVDESLLG